jgi:hypothetical protein
MSIRSIAGRIGTVMILALGMTVAATAQQYQIQRADYGWSNLRIDVTQRLRELARSNATFRMGNSTFGMDPAPGRVKTLRIFAKGPRGASRTFEYREGSVINGAQFAGWGGGDWGHRDEYVILRALYGTERHNVDVTQRLRELAQRDAFFRMGNSTFGVDPDRGRVKTLRIWARGPRGDERLFEYREGSVVDGSQFSGWSGGNWGGGGWNGGWHGSRPPVGPGRPPIPPVRPPVQPGRPPVHPGRPPVVGRLNIVSATYGAQGRSRDVSGRLRSMIRNGRLTLTVDNSSMGMDPAPGMPKTLSVTYSTGSGQSRRVSVREGGQLNIP